MTDTTSDISNTTILGVLFANVAISLLKPIIYRILHNKAIDRIIKTLTIDDVPKYDTHIDPKQLIIDIPHSNTQIDTKHIAIDIEQPHDIEQKK